MTTNSGFAASTTSVLHNSTSGADLNHTATEAKEVETVDVASDALCCGSSAQQAQQQQQQQQQKKIRRTSHSRRQELHRAVIRQRQSHAQDDDNFFDEPTSTVRYGNCQSAHVGVCSQPQMPPYPIGGYMSMGGGYSGAVGGGGVSNANAKGGHAPATQLPSALTTRVLRRTSI
ncbi:unnamed protein product [Ceratitis capitata]|uniref:(Mediterranean fruit fly) hypothetical protein n=1 Tax=Ceratitis capitata TaxID=7213 RepID=A0A811UHV2_CERCA|nr:unnamed protein product [Ceratitis capitata]